MEYIVIDAFMSSDLESLIVIVDFLTTNDTLSDTIVVQEKHLFKIF